MPRHLHVLQFLLLIARANAQCAVGFTGPNGGPCTACIAGTYKTTTGSVACTNCQAGTYSTTVGATVASTCLACPAGSGESCSGCPATTSCTCNTGYTGPNGGTCTACATQTYKSSTGTATCNTCAVNSGSTCSACYTSGCPCNPGYTGDNMLSMYSQTACTRFVSLILSKPSFASVSTRSNTGVGSATLPVYNAAGGPTSQGHVSFDRTISQFLDAGPQSFNLFTNGGFTIVVIVRFTGTVLSNERIIHMWSGTSTSELDVYRYGTTGQIAFQICNAGTGCWSAWLNLGLTQGTTWATVTITYSSRTRLFDFKYGGTGVSWDIGTWNDKILSGILIGKSQIVTTQNFNGDIAGAFVVDQWLSSATTTEIANYMINNLDVTDTTCTTGQVCTECGAGRFKATSGMRTCGSCPANSGASCSSCTASTGCVCNPGFYGPTGGTCTSCPANSGASCIGCTALTSCFCNARFYGTNGGTCIACPANSGASCNGCPASSNCRCNPGYYGPNGGPCTTCPANSGASCNGCTALAGCTCNAGFYGPNGGTCTACPAGCTSPTASTAVGACTCNLGFTGPNGGPCTACVAGTYKTTTGTLTCTSCGAGGYSTTVGATAAATCLSCPAGTYSTTVGATVATTCLSCPAGTYSTTIASTTVTTCLACPTNSGSSCSGCPVFTNCTCNLGFTGPNGGPCVTCNVGFTGPNGGPCTACVAGTYKTTTGSVTCTSCEAGTYSTTAGATTCLACPTSSNSPTASSVLAACTCNIGFTGPNGGPCTACVAGTYKTTTGSVTCTSCGAGTYSSTLAATAAAVCLACPANSGDSCRVCTAWTSCTCNMGYIGSNGGPCTACTAGTYKNTSTTCSACPANSGSSCSGCYTSACPCNAGYTGGNFIAPYSTTACERFVALITWKPSFASVATRANPVVGSSSLPTYNELGGPNGKGHVSFNRVSSQFLQVGPRTFNLATNGGFTIVLVFRWTGTLLASEMMVEMWSGTSNCELGVARYQSTGQVRVFLCNAGLNAKFSFVGTVLAQNTWGTVVTTYSYTTNLLSISVNGAGSQWDFGNYNDKTLSGIYIGNSPITANRQFNGDIAGVFMVDEFLSTAATTEITNAITQGLDMTNTTCPSGNTCTACAGGTYKTSSGSAQCTTCPANSGDSCSGCTALASCTCNAGFYGPNGGTCTACPANSNSPAGSTAAASCTCNPGYALLNGACACDLGYEPGA